MSSGSSGIPWFKIALITAIAGVSCIAAGYAATTWFPKSTETSEAEEQVEVKGTSMPSLVSIILKLVPLLLEKKAPALMKKKKKKIASSRSKASKSTGSKVSSSKQASVDPLQAALDICELSVAELTKLPVETKQQAFYALLVKGEMMLKEGKTEESLTYFMKAINIVPNPSEVLKAYEQTLPTEVYGKIISALKEENRAKTREYFQHLAPENGTVKFVEGDGPKLALTGSASGNIWTAVAAADVEEETILMSEEADIAVSIKSEGGVCDYCFKALDEEPVFHLADMNFCCSVCMKNAEETYAASLKTLTGTPAYAYQQLIKVVQETKTFAPILMLRYVAALLEDELRKQKVEAGSEDVQVSGLFAHYDFLRPAYRAPRDSDKAEAMLIRTILSATNTDVAEFLTDEIYCAMKATVMYNSIGFIDSQQAKPDEDAQLEESREQSQEQEQEQDVAVKAIETNPEDAPKKRALEPIRYAGTTTRASFFGLYHSLAHVSHSCEPNCRLISDAQIPRRLKLVANRPIKANEPLTISYLPADFEGDRAATIASDFHIICECCKCKN